MRQWGIILVVAIGLVNLPTLALEMDISTTFPEYITDDQIFINGTAVETMDELREWSDEDFQWGTTNNLTTIDDALVLKPDVSFDILNNGQPIFTSGPGYSWDSGTGT